MSFVNIDSFNSSFLIFINFISFSGLIAPTRTLCPRDDRNRKKLKNGERKKLPGIKH